MRNTSGIAFFCCLNFFTAAAQIIHQEGKLVGAVNGRAAQGQSVAISASGNIAIAGSPFDASDFGSTLVFTRSARARAEVTKLLGPAVTSTNAPLQGWSVAVSGDGETVLTGAPGDNAEYGSAWVFMRVDGSWMQQRLINQPLIPGQGWSVALSADGNTALIGAVGTTDLCCSGAIVMFTRSNNFWSQLSDPLVTTDGVALGSALALSSDGTIAIAGDPTDGNAGAAYIFSRSGGGWSKEAKLIGSGASGHSGQGYAVALSSDGRTAAIGGPADNDDRGAVWVFTRTDDTWTQVGEKLVGSGAVGAAAQGASVALSADGNTMLIGGPADDSTAGAAWMFVRAGRSWTQTVKLVGSGAIGPARQGASVALSADGATAIVGGPADNSGVGAAWLFGALPSPCNLALSRTSDDCKHPAGR